MFTIKSLKLKVIGFWDQCFFRQNSKYSGLICLDESGNEHLYSYFELRQMMKKESANVQFSIITDENGTVQGVWSKKYKRIIGFNCEFEAGCVDLMFESFSETKQSVKGMYPVVEDCDGDFATIGELEGASVLNKIGEAL